MGHQVSAFPGFHSSKIPPEETLRRGELGDPQDIFPLGFLAGDKPVLVCLDDLGSRKRASDYVGVWRHLDMYSLPDITTQFSSCRCFRFS